MCVWSPVQRKTKQDKTVITMGEKKQVFLVDDHPIICEALEQLINQENDLHVCGCAGDAATAFKAVRSNKPDLVVVDISLQGKSGIELISEIKVYSQDIHTLALSMYFDPLIVDQSMQAGAMGYVNKNEATEVIIEAIRRVINGQIYLSPSISERLLNNFYGKNRHPDRLNVDRLSRRELEIFRLIGQGSSPREIAKILHISVKTVDAHREHIKEKLRLRNSRELYGYALQWGKSSN